MYRSAMDLNFDKNTPVLEVIFKFILAGIAINVAMVYIMLTIIYNIGKGIVEAIFRLFK